MKLINEDNPFEVEEKSHPPGQQIMSFTSTAEKTIGSSTQGGSGVITAFSK